MDITISDIWVTFLLYN